MIRMGYYIPSMGICRMVHSHSRHQMTLRYNLLHHISSGCSSKSSKAIPAESVVVPLYERPAQHLTYLKELLIWRNRARNEALAIGSKFVDMDNGPASEELLRELEWYLEDAVGQCSSNSSDENSLSSWKDIRSKFVEDKDSSSSLQMPEMGKTSPVYLRASMAELSKGWEERTNLRRPFQYVVGCAHWREYVLAVQEGILIPRPETEQMIDLAAAAIAKDKSLSLGKWADLGTGSGAIAIGIASLLRGNKEGSVVAVDISDIAVAVATFNVQRCGFHDVVEVVKGSWFTLSEGNQLGELSGIVSNPPYIPSSNINGLQAEVGRHEPVSALDGGADGLQHLLTICDGACSYLRSGGFLALEMNDAVHTSRISNYLSSKGCFHEIKVVRDFCGTSRFVTALKS